MAGFDTYIFRGDDGYFDAVAETDEKQLSPSPGPAAIVVYTTGTVASFELSVKGSIDGTNFADIDGLDAIIAAGSYPIPLPLPWIQVRCDAYSGTGDVHAEMCWVFD